MDLTTSLQLSELKDSVNIAEKLNEEDLGKIGEHVHRTYTIDKESRVDWEKKNKEATELALQITKPKSYPWKDASNVKFPLLTIASLQFSSRAYPALVKAPDLVKYRVQGADPQGVKSARAHRISAHMSYQLLDQDESWEEEQDKAFIALPITGCIFKKSYYDPTLGHNCSKLVLPMDLVVHYYAKSLEECERKTEVFQLHDRAIRERELKGVYLEHDLSQPSLEKPADADERQGTSPPTDDPDRPRTLLEQHSCLDLDGDGYAEPYVITIDRDTKKVFRIVNRFKEVVTEQGLKAEGIRGQIRSIADGLPKPEEGVTPDQNQLILAQRADATVNGLQEQLSSLEAQKPKVLRIEAVEHYTKYPFIPSADGGFYDIGFGSLLSPLNESVNTLLNQLIDSGSLSNGSMGFIGKGARVPGGKLRFSPFEWKRVNVAGSTLKDSLVPLPVNPPSAVLFQLLSLLISYTERVSSVTDAMSGENPGQNTPAYNMSAMLEQGLQVFNGIFKRVYRAFRCELRKLYALNGLYLDESEYFAYQDAEGEVARDDYRGRDKDLIPAADPNAFANKEKQMKAGIVAERSQLVPGYNPIKVEQRFLESMDIPDAAEIFPVQQGQDGQMQLVFPPAQDPEFVIKQAEEARRTLDAKNKHELAAQETAGKIALMEAQVLKLYAEAEVAADAPELERMKLILEDLSDQRKALTEIAKIEEGSAARADQRMDGKSGNGAT